ncbi:hypothetical protein GCM10027047_00640 [Rhodococcus aerolatus]
MTVKNIDAHRAEFGVESIYPVLQIAPSTYYAAEARPPSARSVTDTTTTAVIRSVHAATTGSGGPQGPRRAAPGRSPGR